MIAYPIVVTKKANVDELSRYFINNSVMWSN